MAAWRYEISLLVLEKYFTCLLRSLMKYFSTLEEKFRISTRPCNILYLWFVIQLISLRISGVISRVLDKWTNKWFSVRWVIYGFKFCLVFVFLIYLDALSFVCSFQMVIISVFYFIQNSIILVLSSCDPSFAKWVQTFVPA